MSASKRWSLHLHQYFIDINSLPFLNNMVTILSNMTKRVFLYTKLARIARHREAILEIYLNYLIQRSGEN